METIFTLFLDPLLRYEFMRNAMLAAAIVGVSSAVLSCLLVVRHQALLGDAVSHAVLPGVAIGWLAARHVGIFWGALTTAILAGLAITFVERNSRVKRDAVMGIVFTFAFAVGLAIISVAKPRGIDLFHVLLGNVLGVDRTDLLLTAVSGGIVVAVVVLLFRQLQLWSFDPVMARSVGLRVGALHYLFTALLSATIVASLQAVGLVLVVAMLVTPGATAYLLTRRLATMMVAASAVGLLSGVGGLYASYHLDVASGPAIVILASVVFALTFAFAPRRGLVSQVRRRRVTGRRILAEDLLKALVKHDGVTALEAAAHLRGDRAGLRSAVRRLTRAGWVTGHDGVLQLTASGRQEAIRMVRTHRLLERYLHDAEGLPIADLHQAADRLEHHVDPAALEDMDRVLGRPTVDPHGHPIPREAATLATIAGCPLTACPPRHTGRVAMVGDDREDLLAAMVRAGIVPQAEITLLERADDHVIGVVAGRRMRLPDELAERVFVVEVHPAVPPAVPVEEIRDSGG